MSSTEVEVNSLSVQNISYHDFIGQGLYVYFIGTESLH
jgi:hypothetical protein